MSRARFLPLTAIFAALSVAGARAADIAVGIDGNLPDLVAHAAPGDVLHLSPGVHRGAVVISTPHLTLQGAPGAIVEGNGEGNTITVAAGDAAIRGLTIRGSGLSLIDKNSAIFIGPEGDRAVIENDTFEANLIGVYLDGPHEALVRANHIHGLTTMRRNERGPGVELWNTPGSRILDNEFVDGRDGVFSVTSLKDVIHGNSFRGVRYAVHFMYTNDSEVSDNVSAGNDIGYAMMYSDHVRLRNNISDGDREHAFLFNYANDTLVEGNAARHSAKCVFIYNANKNLFVRNWFENCGIGIHFTAGSERNLMHDNAFVANQTQVMYVGTRFLDWAVKGRGNYYSDDPAFDLNGDGIADTAYRPNDVVDQVIWRAPAAKLLLDSPAVEVVRWAQSSFPAIHSGGVIDSAPLMTPPRPEAALRLDAMTPPARDDAEEAGGAPDSMETAP